MFGDLAKLEETKARLDAVSPSFCMAKWMHASMHLMTGETHSCYLPQTHKVPLDELRDNPTALHNTIYKKAQREKMLTGVRPEECKICWEVEDLGGTSDRHLRGVDNWTLPYLDTVKALPSSANVNPSYVEVSFSSLCNFKCSYCSPHVSSRWYEEIEKHGPYLLGKSPAGQRQHQNIDWLAKQGKLPMPEDGNPYVDAFWQWWPELVKTLMHFRVTGGEPLLSKHTFKLLDWLSDNPQPQLDLSINSNMGIPVNHVDRFIRTTQALVNEHKIHSFMLHTSVDTFGPHAEYLRHGMDFRFFERNLVRLLEEIPTANVAFMCTFNNLSVTGYRRFIDWVLGLRKRFNTADRQIFLDIPHLMSPQHQSVRILPERYHKMMESHIAYMESKILDDNWVDAGMKSAEVDKMRRILSVMKAGLPTDVMRDLRADFHHFFTEHDRRRGTSFLATFPDMMDFWNLCKQAVEA